MKYVSKDIKCSAFHRRKALLNRSEPMLFDEPISSQILLALRKQTIGSMVF